MAAVSDAPEVSVVRSLFLVFRRLAGRSGWLDASETFPDLVAIQSTPVLLGQRRDRLPGRSLRPDLAALPAVDAGEGHVQSLGKFLLREVQGVANGAERSRDVAWLDHEFLLLV